MVSYEDGNPGEWPVDYDSPVGVFRLLVGDDVGEPFEPDVVGYRHFTFFSDAAIEAMLEREESQSRAVGMAYLRMAGQAAQESKAVKDYDLQVDLTKRAADLRATAQLWFDRADDEDIAGAEEGFVIVDTGSRGGSFIPEAAPPIWGRQYTIGRWR